LADWHLAIDAVTNCAKGTKTPVGVVASLPDTMPEDIAKALMKHGVVPLNGMDTALRALALAKVGARKTAPILLPIQSENLRTLSEAEAKSRLAGFGLPIPKSLTGPSRDQILETVAEIDTPWVLKGLGLAHKSENAAVRVGLTTRAELDLALKEMNFKSYLIEEQVENSILELLIAVTLDPAHGYILTLGAGGTLTELLQDTASLVLPVTESDVDTALASLRCAPILDGYRGAQAVDRKAIWIAIEAVQNYVIAHQGQVQEVEINPLICTSSSAIAVDALIVQGDPK